MDQQVERHSHCLHFIPLKLFNSLGNLKIFSLCQKLLVETNSISIGTEKGSMESKREGLMWHMEIRNEADPFFWTSHHTYLDQRHRNHNGNGQDKKDGGPLGKQGPCLQW